MDIERYYNALDVDTGLEQGHKGVAELLGELCSALERGKDEDALLAIVQMLLLHGDEQFRHEDRVMAQRRFPYALKHRTEHEELLAFLREASADLEMGLGLEPGRALPFLQSWIKRHLSDSDCRFNRFCKPA